MFPINYAEQRGHTECIKLLQNYGHRRPLSAVSHAAIPPPTAMPTLDEHGHIQLKNPTRRFSLSGESVTSFERRLPADGTEDSGRETEQTRLQPQTSARDEVDCREEGVGEQNQSAETEALNQVRKNIPVPFVANFPSCCDHIITFLYAVTNEFRGYNCSLQTAITALQKEVDENFAVWLWFSEEQCSGTLKLMTFIVI